jgi:lysophospholipase L1-like esterase
MQPAVGIADSAPPRAYPLRRLAMVCLGALLATVAADALLFRTGLYSSIIEPDSSAGVFELVLARERQAQAANGDNLVVTLGDSRFAYLPRQADELTPETGYVFRSAGVAGSDARMWYYLMRALDPTARRYRAIVIGVNDYDDEDGGFDVADDLRALHYLIAELRVSDILDFSLSFHDRAARWEAFRGATLKGLVYQADVLAFLSNPRKRIDYVNLCRRGWPTWTWDYQESTRSMAGLQVDWTRWTAVFPPDADANQRESVERFLMYKPFPPNGTVAAFRRHWFGKLIARYRGSLTRIVFLRLPRGPVVRPENLAPHKSAAIREFASIPNVMLADEWAFQSLERPELFKDGLHLNREGAARFSAMMAREIRKMLAPWAP